MGAKPSVQFTQGADSLVDAKQKVCVSQTLELDPNALLEELVEQLRYPVDNMKEYVLKSCDVEEHGPDEFTVKVILDGKKLDRYRYGKGDGTDRIDLWTRIVVDRKARKIESRPIVPPPGCWVNEVDSVKGGGYGRFQVVTEPVRVEFHIGTPDGATLADDQAVQTASPTVTAALTNMEKRKVKVLAEQESLRGGGLRSVISEPMDEHIDFDGFWDKFLAIIKSPPGSPVKPEVTEVSAEEFHTSVVVPESKQKLVTQVKHSKAAGEVTVVTLSDGQKMSTSTVVLHQKPLRVESWGEDAEGTRQSGRGAAKGLQEYVDMVLAKKSHRSWFSR